MILIDARTLAAIQAQLARQHGGRVGLKDAAGLDNLQTRAEMLADSAATDVAALAALYGFVLTQDAPFHSQNAGTALVVVELFLNLNGYRLDADDTACFLGISLAGQSELGPEAFAGWLRGHAVAHVRDGT